MIAVARQSTASGRVSSTVTHVEIHLIVCTRGTIGRRINPAGLFESTSMKFYLIRVTRFTYCISSRYHVSRRDVVTNEPNNLLSNTDTY